MSAVAGCSPLHAIAPKGANMSPKKVKPPEPEWRKTDWDAYTFLARDLDGDIHTVEWTWPGTGNKGNPKKNPSGITGYALRDGVQCRIHLCGHNPCQANWNNNPTKYLPHLPPMHHQFVAWIHGPPESAIAGPAEPIGAPVGDTSSAVATPGPAVTEPLTAVVEVVPTVGEAVPTVVEPVSAVVEH